MELNHLILLYTKNLSKNIVMLGNSSTFTTNLIVVDWTKGGQEKYELKLVQLGMAFLTLRYCHTQCTTWACFFTKDE